MSAADAFSAPAPGRGLDPLTEAFTAARARLRRTVQLHLDGRLVGRVDPDDVLQESYLAAQRRFDPDRPPPVDALFVWLRTIVKQTTVDVARRHLDAAMRTANQEVRLDGADAATTALALRDALLSRLTSPSQAAARAEVGERLAAAIAQMSELDREILLLRHFEELGNGEAALVLGIHKAAATNRYLRALQRLRGILPPELGAAP